MSVTVLNPEDVSLPNLKEEEYEMEEINVVIVWLETTSQRK